MKLQALLFASLAALGASTALPKSSSTYWPSMCNKAKGLYDVCDTNHSYIRCHGHDALAEVDCRLDNTTYCRVVNDHGTCRGTSPPYLFSDDIASCEIALATAAAALSTKST
ncbi:hypothetical protein F5B18DRAFT_653962 [Nemania serpens]|nr:hypothetical protein F5B18DRAFT_653962 [Nemania serpens]